MAELTRQQLRAADRYLRRCEIPKDVRQFLRNPGDTNVTAFIMAGFHRVGTALVDASDEVREVLAQQHEAALTRLASILEGDLMMLWFFAYSYEPTERERLSELLKQIAGDVRDVEARDDRWQTRKALRDASPPVESAWPDIRRIYKGS